MDFNIIRVRSSIITLIILIASTLILLLTTSSLFVYYFVHTELSILSVLGFIGMILICLPICIYEYVFSNEKPIKKIFLSISITLIALILSGVFWYIISINFEVYIAIPIGMLLMAIGYLPIIYILYSLYREKKDKVPKIIKNLIQYINVMFIIFTLFFVTSYLMGDNEKSYDILIYSFSLIGDISIISLCILLILINIPTKQRYVYSILLGFYILSFMGDSLRLLSYTNLYETRDVSQIFYDIMLIYLSVTLIIYVLSNIKLTTIEEISKQLEDTTLVIEDLIMQSPDAVCMCDSNGNILKTNENFDRSFNIIKSSNEKINIFNNVIDLNDEITSKLTDAKNGRTVHIENVNYKTRDNLNKYYSIKFYPTYSKDKKIINYLFNAEDITLRKFAEDALKDAYDEMESRVRERTAELVLLTGNLQEEIAEHKKDEEKIKTSLKEKEVLLKEIHHRVKNNMQIISSMLGLQSLSVKDSMYGDMLRDSQNRIRSMALIHEKLYQSENMADVDFSEYIDSLISNITKSYHLKDSIVITKDVKEFSFSIDTAIPLGLIINELISNAIKHAFPDNKSGEIQLQINRVDGSNKYNLNVNDNGIGMDPGFVIENSKSLGLKLVQALVDQLEGDLKITTSNEGTLFSIDFEDK